MQVEQEGSTSSIGTGLCGGGLSGLWAENTSEMFTNTGKNAIIRLMRKGLLAVVLSAVPVDKKKESLNEEDIWR